MSRIAPLVFCFLALITAARSFYFPDVVPRDFQKGDELQVKVNKLSSTTTQLPYLFYYLRYCRPSQIRNTVENLGEALRADRNSIYTFRMREDQPCTMACRVVLDAQAAKDFQEKIDDNYRANMILDNLPVAVRRHSLDKSPSTIYEWGFDVGFKRSYAGSQVYKYYLNNHLSFTVMYHRDRESDSARIVGFEVTPKSIKHEVRRDGERLNVSTCDKNTTDMSATDLQEVDAGKLITFSYSVTYKESEVKWASRWDTYHLMNDDQIYWFSIVNSLLIVIFLSGIVAMIMMRTLYKDIASYNQLETKDEAKEGTGWKLVHGDVFRPPRSSGLLCVCAGTGVQLLGTTLMAMILAFLGLNVSFSNPGEVMTAIALAWGVMGFFGGYSSSRLHKMFDGTEWKTNAFKMAVLVPGVLFAVFFMLNALIWGELLSWAIPLGTIFVLIFLWFGISVPLVFVGGYFGFKKTAIQYPTKTRKIPRQIPQQPWYLRPVLSMLMGGILPFGAVLAELFFILTSVWVNRFCYIFGFLIIVLVILMITCAEITIVLCYFQLCREDYNWWWRAYLTAGSSAFYLFLYSVFYFFSNLAISKPVSVILYFGYMLIVSCSFFVLTGTVGFFACFWFVSTIYSSVKID